MKKIKKISTTPLPKTEGSIIDSPTTSDDQRKNTFSIRIIKEKINEVITRCKANSDFIVLTGNVTIQGHNTSTISIGYPPGFNQNATVLSCGLMVTNSLGWNYIADFNNTEGEEPTYKRKVTLTPTNIVIQIVSEYGSSTNFQYKIVLMKEPQVIG